MKKLIYLFMAALLFSGLNAQAGFVNGSFDDSTVVTTNNAPSLASTLNNGWTVGTGPAWAITDGSAVLTRGATDTLTTGISQVITAAQLGSVSNLVISGSYDLNGSSSVNNRIRIYLVGVNDDPANFNLGITLAPAATTGASATVVQNADSQMVLWTSIDQLTGANQIDNWAAGTTTEGTFSVNVDVAGMSGYSYYVLQATVVGFFGTASENSTVTFNEMDVVSSLTTPVLAASGVLSGDGDGNGLYQIAETNNATITLSNVGTEATNFTAQLVLPPEGYFTASATNFTGPLFGSSNIPITLIAATNTPPGNYTFAITNLTCDDPAASKTAGSFTMSIRQGVTVSGQTNNTFILPPADINQTVTNTSMVISNSTIIPLICEFSESAPWLTLPIGSPVTIPPKGSTNVLLVGNSADAGSFSNTLSVSYSQTVTNFSSFTVNFGVGPKISYQSNAVYESINLFGGAANGRYEPGEQINIFVYNVNDGAINLTYITNSLTPSTPSLFTFITPAFDTYASMPVGSVSTTKYIVAISTNAPNGPQTFTVINRTATGAWTNTFDLPISVAAFPSVLTNAITLRVETGKTGSETITLTNGGNANTTFAFSGNPNWVTNIPSSGTLTQLTSRTVSFVANATGISTGTTSYTSYISWGNGETSEVAVTVIVLPPPAVNYASRFAANRVIPGDTVDVYLSLTNSGSLASNVTAYITPVSSGFTVTANGSPASFGNINEGAVASNALPVKIKVNIATAPGTYTFNVTNIAAANGGTPNSGSFTLTVEPLVQYVSTSPTNGIFAGGAMNAYITLTNCGSGSSQARFVTADITHTNNGFTVQSGSGVSFGTINAGKTASNSVPVVIRADGTVMPGTYRFDVTNIVTADGYKGGTGSFTVVVQAPVRYVSTRLSPTNRIFAGGAVNAYITLTNSSGTAASAVFATVSTTNAGFTVQSGSPASFGTINAGKTATNSVPVVIHADGTVMPGTYRFDVTDIGGAGSTGSFNVEVQPPVQYVATLLSTNAILPGGTINAYVVLANSSGAEARYVTANISTTNAGFSISGGSPASFGSIAAGTTATNSAPVVIGTDITIQPETYTFNITDIVTADSARAGNTNFTVTITYVVFEMEISTALDGTRTLTWTKSVDGLSRTYKVYYKDSLSDPDWTLLATVINGYSYVDDTNPAPVSRNYLVTVE